MNDLRSGAAIIALSVGAACGYGILHDLVTTRVCLEYFTVWHPPIFGGTHDPTLLALGWGVIATWWVGLPIGCVLALAARYGGWPKLAARDLVPGLLATLVFMAECAYLAGGFGYGEPSAELLALSKTPEQARRLNADYDAHSASYGAGVLGGAVLCIVSVVRRARRRRSHVAEGRPAALGNA